jgi:hypothetical protein
MKSLKEYIYFTAFITLIWACKKPCNLPSIQLEPVNTNIFVKPGEVFRIKIHVNSEGNNIYSVVVSKTSNGKTQADFLVVSPVDSNITTVDLVDSIDNSLGYGSIINYNIKATSDCKSDSAAESKITVTVIPSSDPITANIGNTQAPRVYNRFSTSFNITRAWNLQKVLPLINTDNNDDKDICDSVPVKTPFFMTVWGSRNGCLFKNVNGMDYSQATPQQLYDAWNSGSPGSDLINIFPNDLILVNIKNKNRFALVRIKVVYDDGASFNDDYTYFEYKLAQ